tara:strand:- start:101 stop:475 length:375 start_codon:yes stop_codon:yes gene_type:complete
MTAPNIVNVATITAKTAYVDLSSTNATTVLSNAASSNKVFKVNTCIIANVDPSNSADITLTINSEDDGGGTAYAIASTVLVPSDSSLVIIDGNSKIYLEEDRSLVATASAANDLEVIISYEELS